MDQIQEIEPKTLITNRFTGEIVDQIPSDAKPGEYRIQRDWTEVPSHTDQSQRDENNINVLMEKYKPDELAQYLAQKNGHRPEINNHDFSEEPTLQNAMNSAYEINKIFESMPEQIQKYFDRKPAQFLEFCENPQNIPQLKEWGLYNLKELQPDSKREIQNRDEVPKLEPIPAPIPKS